MSISLPVHVAKSSIHGRGVFASSMISTGTKIGDYLGVPTTRDGRYVLWLDAGDDRWIGIRGTTELKYLNHSSSPNAEFNHLGELFALQDISPGEEITIHYGDDWVDVP